MGRAAREGAGRGPRAGLRAVEPLSVLPERATVRTGPGGMAPMANGFDGVKIGPSTTVEFAGGAEKEVVNQPEGLATYEVGKRKTGRFEVRAPMLTTVVKGTAFTVEAAPTGAAVDVS
jgi:hypothetical protein